jgi:diaminopropionate ammonia-lyase
MPRSCLLISDTSWPAYEEVPRWVIDGYSTTFREIDEELEWRREPGPDVVVVQIGVWAVAAAAARHYRRPASVASTEASQGGAGEGRLHVGVDRGE